MADTLLIADRSKASANRTRGVFADRGYDASVALSAAGTLHVCRELKPAVVIASAQPKRLFKVFYSTKGIQGTGLGLFIADQIVRQHGGGIVVESSPGQGCRFCVRLPRSGAGFVQRKRPWPRPS